MSYTKKRLTAFRDILSFCPEDRAVIHTFTDWDETRYIVTDGSVCVVLTEKPEGFPMRNDGKYFYDFCQKESADGDHRLVEHPVTAADCKAAIRQWKQERKSPLLSTPEQPRIKVENDNATGWYDARRLLAVMTAIGPKAQLYIGRRVRGQYRTSFPTLIVKEDISGEEFGVVLPIRVG